MEKEKRLKELVKIINEANQAYYNEDKEIMSNYEWDALYDELLALESETGIILSDSPTQGVFASDSDLESSEHEFPALSLNKTKLIDEIKSFLGDKTAVISWKCDGLTIVSTYEDGVLKKIVTRGNGYIGEDVTHNLKYISGLPTKISCKEKVIVRSEALMTYDEFNRIKDLYPEVESKYKNPRNLASATCRLKLGRNIDNRQLESHAFDLVFVDNDDYNSNSFYDRLEQLNEWGFKVTEHQFITKENCESVINRFKEKIISNSFPSDGLVLILNDVAYGKSLGFTGKYPRNGIAFKWQDKTATTTLEKIHWSPARTGVITPVAVFKTVSLEGTDVSRASVHNVSIAKELKLGVGSEISVYKANMIIPKIEKTIKSTGDTIVPDKCPLCSANTKIVCNDGIEILYCTGDECPAKHIGKLAHFASITGMNIIGLSDKKLTVLVDNGLISCFTDIYNLDYTRVAELPGFGKQSAENLRVAIENSKKCEFSSFLSALSIPGIGPGTAKQLAVYCSANGGFKTILSANDWSVIKDIGVKTSDYINDFVLKNRDEMESLMEILEFKEIKTESTDDKKLSGKTFCITGKLIGYPNRDALVSDIEKNGGKVSSSVSSKTDYLINNDIESVSGKDKVAKKLGVCIISEEEFKALI